MMICYQESPTHQNFHLLHWMTEIELTGEECLSQKGVKTSKVCQRSTIGKKVGKRIIYSVCLNFSIRYSSILENYSDNNSSSAPVSGAGMSYLATTSTSSKVNPQYKTYRSNSQNRIMSPTFNNSYHHDNNSYHNTNAYATMSRRPERLKRHSSLGHEPTTSSSSSSLRLDNYVTLHHRRRSDFAPNTSYNNSASPSPMVLSPSNTRQFNCNNNQSREGSVTPRFSHSCSNTSLVSESTAPDI
jgi:hypothetical protein